MTDETYAVVVLGTGAARPDGTPRPGLAMTVPR